MSKLIEYGERLMRVADRAQGAAGFGTTANFQIELMAILNEVIGPDELQGMLSPLQWEIAQDRNALRQLQRERAGL